MSQVLLHADIFHCSRDRHEFNNIQPIPIRLDERQLQEGIQDGPSLSVYDQRATAQRQLYSGRSYKNVE